uniref:Lipocalin n=1 Tax=Rhipicephalus zambeziensis TaxID=60191 RepID=A0A224YBT3_9ACAR
MHLGIIFFPLLISFQFLQWEGKGSTNAMDSTATTPTDKKNETRELPIWANETRLGKYQHAEWVVANTSTFYLVKATFRDREQLWDCHSMCISRNYSKTNGTYMTEFSFIDDSKQNKTLNLSTSLTSTYNYSIRNAIQYQLRVTSPGSGTLCRLLVSKRHRYLYKQWNVHTYERSVSREQNGMRTLD